MHRAARWVVLSLVLPGAAFAGEPDAPARNPLTFGVGLGRAWVRSAGSEAGWALRLRAVAPVAPRVELGLEVLTETSVFSALSTVDVAATFYPGAGFLLRGGVGASRWDEATGPWFSNTVSNVGANVLAGAGYSLGGARGLAVSVNLEAQLHLLDQPGAWDRKASALLWIGLDWR